jgi:hypothetical protein
MDRMKQGARFSGRLGIRNPLGIPYILSNSGLHCFCYFLFKIRSFADFADFA